MVTLPSTVTGCFYFCICPFSLCSWNYCKPAARIKTLAIIATIKKTQKKHDKIALLPKIKLNIVKVLNIDSNIILDEFVLINNVQKEYDKMKKKIKNSNNIK